MDDRSVIKYFESAYQEANTYSQKVLEEYENIGASYVKKDKFYTPFSSKEIVWTAVYLIVGIAGLILHGTAFGYIEKYLFSRWKFDVLEGYLSLVYDLAFIGLLALGIWYLFKFIYSKKVKHELDGIAGLSDSLKADLKNLREHVEERMAEFLADPGGVSIGNANQHENALAKYKNKVDTIEKKTTQVKRIFLCVLFAALMVIHFLFLGRYAVVSIEARYSYPSTFVVCSSYLLLFAVLYEFQVSTYEYLKRTTKYVAIAAFVIYQAAMGLLMRKYDLFHGMLHINSDLKEDAAEWLLMIYDFLEKYILTKGALILIVPSILCIMFIIRTDAEKDIRMGREGFVVPMLGAADRVYSATHTKIRNKGAFIAGAAYAAIAPKYMAQILGNKMSFGRVVLYIVLGMVWFGVGLFFPGKEGRAVCGKRLDWVKHSFFVCYMFLTLAMLPGFDVDRILLILLQPALTIIVFGIIGLII
ncbi:MAG: hypothetical protein NC318_08075 [Blautia sp.]|nr:hypothetical protein [Lachnoclostridium sp.]MCM1211546.1 hypothetical protein [Blautia sp.]